MSTGACLLFYAVWDPRSPGGITPTQVGSGGLPSHTQRGVSWVTLNLLWLAVKLNITANTLKTVEGLTLSALAWQLQ